jgi:hypothetical protein
LGEACRVGRASPGGPLAVSWRVEPGAREPARHVRRRPRADPDRLLGRLTAAHPLAPRRADRQQRRLRAHGLDVTAELDVENWFLNPPEDVRSSHAMEVPATEFAIRELELDWTGLARGGDLEPGDRARRACRSFRGTAWQHVRDETTRRYIMDKYRVLLTRAREGLVVFVPPGDPEDPTQDPALMDRVADYLRDYGFAPACRCPATRLRTAGSR